MKAFKFQLESDRDLLLSIQKIAQEQSSSGFVLGVVGNLSTAIFQCPELKKPTVLNGNLEIITLNGTFSPEKMHLHLSISDSSCKVFGGHLEPGSRVLKGVDLLLGFITGFEDFNIKNVVKNNHSEIKIATLKSCPWSLRSLRLLNSLDVTYENHLVDSDEKFEEFRSLSGVSKFPQVYIDNTFIGGYQELLDFYRRGGFKL